MQMHHLHVVLYIFLILMFVSTQFTSRLVAQVCAFAGKDSLGGKATLGLSKSSRWNFWTNLRNGAEWFNLCHPENFSVKSRSTLVAPRV